MDDAKIDRYFELVLKAFDESRTEICARLDGVESRLDAVERRLDAVESRLDAVESRLHVMSIGANERFQSVLDRLDLLEHRMEKATSELGAMRLEIRDLTSEVGGTKVHLTSEIDGVKNELFKLDTRLDKMQMTSTVWPMTCGSGFAASMTESALWKKPLPLSIADDSSPAL